MAAEGDCGFQGGLFWLPTVFPMNEQTHVETYIGKRRKHIKILIEVIVGSEMRNFNFLPYNVYFLILI